MRGNLITVALQGDYGKPLPAVVIQSDLFDQHPSVTLLPLTSDLRDTPLFRITIEPSPENGLRQRSQVMVDRIHTVSRAKVGPSLGRLSDDEQRVFSHLAVFRGGVSRAAAEAVAGGSLAVLSALVAKSLVRRDAGGRYEVHELLRQYAAGRLDERPAELMPPKPMMTGSLVMRPSFQ